ncbi:MAG: preprotein translocase subunit SecA [Candidatus Coatesbacteria bacterium]|nr:preprotein translocase subunit SecA [Candidatus Coatesbacteria bacterium]
MESSASMGLLAKIFGTKKERDIKSVNPLVERINEAAIRLLEEGPATATPADEDETAEGDFWRGDDLLERWHARFAELTIRRRERLATAQAELEAELEGEDDEDQRQKKLAEGRAALLDDELLVETYATVKTACIILKENGATWTVVGHPTPWEMVPYDVQLVGAVFLHHGHAAEMATGEGKTLVATMPLYLNALTGKGVHLVTVNDYLARRDSQWMGGLLRFLGLTVDCIQHEMRPPERRAAYACDVTYGTNNEFGFDYLRDNGTAVSPEQCVQRGHYFAIIDEVDSVLIDEARTPLIISGPAPESTHRFDKLNPLVNRLAKRQAKLIAGLLTEADKLLKEGDDDSVRLAAKRLLLARMGSPKNRRLLKFLEDPSLKRKVTEIENEFNMAKKLGDLKEELYYTIEEKSYATDLTERGREALSPDDPQRFVIPDLDALFTEVDELDIDPVEKEKRRQEVIERASVGTEEIQNILQLVKAYTLYERDEEYVVKDNRVIIVDEFTGRPMPGRRYSDGLHQAIEAKEGVKIERETITLATITLQNYFRLYEKLAGMTGTAETEAQEFGDIYNLDVKVVPTNEPVRRIDYDDLIYKTRREKYNAVIEEIEYMRELGRPVLVGTVSVDVSEVLSRLLKRRNIPHNVLNAKQHQREAEIVREAGLRGRVTIATNMAGRGTDIKLGEDVLWCRYPEDHPRHPKGLCCIKCRRTGPDGEDLSYQCATCPKILSLAEEGDEQIETAPPGKYKMPCKLVIDPGRPPDDSKTVDAFVKEGLTPCGLHIVGTERHDARRIDRQLRGRAGRQGDPGSSRFYLSVEDNLMRLFGSERIAAAMERGGIEEGEPIAHPLITRMIGTAQEKVEQVHFGSRKRTLDYDDVVNKQREVIYKLRRRILEGRDLKGHLLGLMEEAVVDHVDLYCPEELDIGEEWRLDDLRGWYMATFPAKLTAEELERLAEEQDREKLIEVLFFGVRKAFELREEQYEGDQLHLLMRFVLLSHLDKAWKEHLRNLESIREGIGLRAYGQRDPLIEYKKEAFEAFSEMMDEINGEVVSRFFRYKLTAQSAEQARRRVSSRAGRGAEGASDGPGPKARKDAVHTRKTEDGTKLGRNDPCPCGSGKKYKKCCWDKDHAR